MKRNHFITLLFYAFAVLASSCRAYVERIDPVDPKEDSIPYEDNHIKIEFAPDLSFISNQFVSGMHFFNELTGVVITTNGEIYRTENGCVSWTLIYTDNDIAFLNQMIFVTPDVGYAVGGITNPLQGSILKTTDAGVTWNKIFKQQDVLFSSIAMNSTGSLFATVNGIKQQLYKSTDNGISWNMYLDSIISSSFITFNEGRGFCTNNEGDSMLISDDDGITWYEDSLFYAFNTYDIRFKDGVGYCNADLYVFKTYDNGHTWFRPVGILRQTNSIAPLSRNSWITFGIGYAHDSDVIRFHGVINQTWNDRDWNSIEFKNVGSIYANSFYTEHNGYASAKNKLLKITIK